MALESQGVQIRRASSVELNTAVTSLSFVAATTSINSDNTAIADFVALGYSTGMVVTSNSTVDDGAYVISAVATSKLTLHQPCTNHDDIGLTIKGQTMAAIAEITNFSGPTGSANVIDITSLQSTAKEKFIGIRDEGQVTMEVILETSAAAQHTNLKDDRKNRTKRSFDILLTDAAVAATTFPTMLYFDAYVSGFSISGAIDEVLKGSLTLEISTAVRWMAPQ